MTEKYRQQYRRDLRARDAAKISAKDEDMLELMRKLRTHTYASRIGGNPRSLAAQALQRSIDQMAEVITGDREYFYAKHHSIG